MVSQSKSDSLLSNVVDITISANPRVSENPGGSESTTGHGEESYGALSVPDVIQNVLSRGHIVVISIYDEGQFRKRVHLSAVDLIGLVLAVIDGTSLGDNLENFCGLITNT